MQHDIEHAPPPHVPIDFGETGDEVVTGGEHSSPQQRQACDALVAWLVGLLAAMPLDQSLLPRASAPSASAAAAEPVAKPPEQPLPSSPSPSSSVAGEEGERREQDDTGGERVDTETERVRRSMREEARSAVLRTLATLLAGCGDETRHTASSAAASAMVGHLETRLVPLCLRLLHGCGGAADPKTAGVEPPGGGGPEGAAAAAAAEMAAAAAASGGEPLGEARRSASARTPPKLSRGAVPAGRKVELLKVIGNACFRCRASQDSVREEGGLPLVLNHCAVDGANPLLRCGMYRQRRAFGRWSNGANTGGLSRLPRGGSYSCSFAG